MVGLLLFLDQFHVQRFRALWRRAYVKPSDLPLVWTVAVALNDIIFVEKGLFALLSEDESIVFV